MQLQNEAAFKEAFGTRFSKKWMIFNLPKTPKIHPNRTSALQNGEKIEKMDHQKRTAILKALVDATF